MYVSYTLDHLLSANLFLGFHLTFRHASIMKYLSRPMAKVDIFNLAFTFFNLRLIMSFIQQIYINRGLVWFHAYMETLFILPFRLKSKLSLRSFTKSSLKRKKKIKKVRLIFLYLRWYTGMLTNFKRVKFMVKSVYKMELFYPSVVFFSSFVRSKHIVIPIINVCDSFNNILNKCFVITANQKSLKSLLFLMLLFLRQWVVICRLKKNLFCNYVLDVI